MLQNLKYFLFNVVLLISFGALSQDTLHVSTEDGSHDYELIVRSNSDKDIARLNVWFGLMLKENSVSFAGISYYIPRKQLFNLTLGPGASFDGVLFFKSSEKNKTIRQSVDVERESNMATYFIAEVPNIKTRSLGFHYGFGHTDFFRIDGNSASHLRGGFTFLRSENAHWILSSKLKEAKGGRRSTLNLDGVYFFNHYDNVENQGSKEFRKLGFSLNLEGYLGSWSRKGHFGYKYLLGVGSGPFISETYFFQFGFGINLSYL